jgi:hypothetical protein
VIGTMELIWESNVFVPASAKLFQADHGPASDVAVVYALSLVFPPVRCEPKWQ